MYKQVRNRNVGVGKRNCLNKVKSSSIYTELVPWYTSTRNGSPHVLFELTERTFHRYKRNSILLSSMKHTSSIIHFDNVNVGDGLIWNINNQSGTNDVISLSNMKDNFVFILMSKDELIKSTWCRGIIVLPQGCRNEYNDRNECKHKPSGYVVLMLAKQQTGGKKTDILWGEQHYKSIKKCKKSVIDSNNGHHGSNGKYFSFGNRASYATVGRSSVTQYAYKKNNSIGENVCGVMVEELVSRVLKSSIVSLEKIVPMIHAYVAPVIDTAAKLQAMKKHDILKENEYSKYGIWKTVFCVNATTERLHTERDCSYTVIHVPLRDKKVKKCAYFSRFQLNDKESIYLPMHQNLTFMFSGCLLTHQQINVASGNAVSNDEEFFNFGTYANRRLFYRVKKSINRN